MKDGKQLYELIDPDRRAVPKGEAEVIHMYMVYHGKPITYDELVLEAEKRNLAAHFKQANGPKPSTTVPESVEYWLKKFKKDRIVRTVPQTNTE